MIALFVPAVSATAEAVASAIAEAGAAAGADKPLLAVVMSAEGIPAPLRAATSVSAFTYPESAARALGRAAERADWLRRPLGTVPEVDGIDHEVAAEVVANALADAEDRWLEPDEARKLLLAYGIPLVARAACIVGGRGSGRRPLGSGFPVVVKTAAAGAHKTETGGIALDLTDEGAVRSAVERIGTPVVVQPMITGGTELLAGLVQDPVFGPLVAFGPGGVLAELIGQASFRIAPLTDVDAEELVLEGKAGRLVRGFRGAPPSDVAALVDLVQRLSRLGLEIPAVAELDLNPVLGLPDGCVAVDARVRVARPVVNALDEELVAARSRRNPRARAGFYRCREPAPCATLVSIKGGTRDEDHRARIRRLRVGGACSAARHSNSPRRSMRRSSRSAQLRSWCLPLTESGPIDPVDPPELHREQLGHAKAVLDELGI